MKKIIGLIILIIVIVGVGLFVANKMGAISLFGFSKINDEVKIDKTANVVTEIKNISKFTTAYYYEELTLEEKKKNSLVNNKIGNTIASWLGKSKEGLIQDELCLIVNGKVRAGYDLSAIQQEDILINGDTLIVKLPKVVIFDVVANPSNVDIFIEDGDWSHQEIAKIQSRAKNRLEADAKKSGILETAKKSGEKQLKILFKTFGFKQVILK